MRAATEVDYYGKRAKQSLRDLFSVVLFAAAIAAYWIALRSYLRGLDRPIFAEIGFGTSLALACIPDLFGKWFRRGIVECVVTVCVAVSAIYLATWLRSEYVGWLHDLAKDVSSSAEFARFVGRDAHSALTSRYVGYGACYGIALILCRLILRDAIRAILIFLLLRSRTYRMYCEYCGQCISRESVGSH